MNIDPALRNDGSSANLQQRNALSYAANPQTPGYETLQSTSSTDSPIDNQGQHNQYYGLPTPGIYPNGTGQSAGSPFENSPRPANPADPNDLKRSRACEACRQLKVRCEPDDNSPTGSCKRCAKANRPCVITAPSRKRQKKTDSRVAELEKKIDALTASLVARGTHDAKPQLDPAIAQAQMDEIQKHREQLYEDRQWPHSSRESISSQPSPATPESGAGFKRRATGSYTYSDQELVGHASSSHALKTAAPPVPLFKVAPAQLGGVAIPGARRSPSDLAYVDVIDSGILDQTTAYRTFNRYNRDMSQFLPVVAFPPGTEAEDVRRSKPFLFLAILAVAVSAFQPETQPRLISEATRIVAERVVYRGEKSLEFVQMVNLLSIYYQPPEKYEELNFNQMIHIAAIMAIDLGMGKRSKPGALSSTWREYMDKKALLPDPNSAETRRTWLGCYYMCANASMSLRRPLLVRWSPYNDECLDILANGPDALPSDKFLCHLIRNQHIAENVGFQFSMDDPVSSISLADPKTQYHLKAFERELQEWHNKASKEISRRPHPSDGLLTQLYDQASMLTNSKAALIQHHESILNLYMHEIAMHHDHNIDDFKPPFNIAVNDDQTPETITPAHIDSLTVCLDSVHRAFDAFLAMDVEAVRALPTIVFVRNSYASVALIKMYSAVVAKGSKFAPIFKVSDLKVEYYLDALISSTARAAENNRSRVAHKFSFIFSMLKGWYLKRTDTWTAAGAYDSQPKPGDEPARSAPTNQDPSSTSSSSTSSWHFPNPDPKQAQRSGLQMLSDAAMVKNNPSSSSSSKPATAASTSTSLSTIPATNDQQQWAPQTSGHMQLQSNVGAAPVANDAMTNFALPGLDFTELGFTVDYLNAMNNLVEDPGWMTFPIEQGGWAF